MPVDKCRFKDKTRESFNNPDSWFNQGPSMDEELDAHKVLAGRGEMDI